MYIDPLSRHFLNGAGQIPFQSGRGPVVLMYHSIETDGAPLPTMWSVSARSFREQLRLLKDYGWSTICVRDLLEPARLPRKAVAITFDDGYANNYPLGFQVLREFGMTATWYVVSRDVGGVSSWSDPEQPPRNMLGGSQLREMTAAGMEISAHTRSHPQLTRLDDKAIHDEIGGSKKDLEDVLGTGVESFAYPFGLYDERCVAAVREAGYRTACTTRTGWAGSDPDPLRIRRVTVHSYDTPSSFARKLAFADNNVSWTKIRDYAWERIWARLKL